MSAGIQIVAETCILILTHAISSTPLYLDFSNVGALWANQVGGSVMVFTGGGKIAVDEKISDIIDAIRNKLPTACIKAMDPHVHPHDKEPEE